MYDRGKLVYAGHVGGGFNQELLRTIYHQMVKLKIHQSPFVHLLKPNAPVTWIKPKLVCEVSFSEWTKEGLMRQPIFQGLRMDKSSKEVVRKYFS